MARRPAKTRSTGSSQIGITIAVRARGIDRRRPGRPRSFVIAKRSPPRSSTAKPNSAVQKPIEIQPNSAPNTIDDRDLEPGPPWSGSTLAMKPLGDDRSARARAARAARGAGAPRRSQGSRAPRRSRRAGRSRSGSSSRAAAPVPALAEPARRGRAPAPSRRAAAAASARSGAQLERASAAHRRPPATRRAASARTDRRRSRARRRATAGAPCSDVRGLVDRVGHRAALALAAERALDRARGERRAISRGRHAERVQIGVRALVRAGPVLEDRSRRAGSAIAVHGCELVTDQVSVSTSPPWRRKARSSTGSSSGGFTWNTGASRR